MSFSSRHGNETSYVYKKVGLVVRRDAFASKALAYMPIVIEETHNGQ